MKQKSSTKKITLLLILVVLSLVLVACGGKGNDSTDKKIVIGSKDFTENLVVSELYALALEDAGFKVERKFNIAGSIVHSSIINKEIDMYPEYTGTGLLSVLKMPLLTDSQEVYDTVSKEYEDKFKITWLDYSKANDSNGLVITKKASDKYGIKTISQLQEKASKLRLASQSDFVEREDGLKKVESVYGKMDFKNITIFSNSLKYNILDNDEADVTVAYTTEGMLVETDKYVVLEDDKNIWPPYNLAPIVRDEILTKYPEIKSILNKITALLDNETVIKLNGEVDIEKREFEDVAKEFYKTIKWSFYWI